MANIKYRLSRVVAGNKAELLCRFYASRKDDFRASTRIFVPVNLWDDQTQRLVFPRRFATADTIAAGAAQKTMDELTQFIFTEYDGDKEVKEKNWLSITIKKFWDIQGGIVENDGSTMEKKLQIYDMVPLYFKANNITSSSIRKFRSIGNIFKRFCDNVHPIYIENITYQDVEDFAFFLRTEEKDGVPINRSVNTVNTKLRALRAVCNWAKKNGMLKESPFETYKISADVYGTPTYLTVEERDKLYHADVGQDYITQQRDIFIFQCFVGCRVSDLVTLTTKNLTRDGFLQYSQYKLRTTNPITVRVPLSETALEILDKYKGRPDGRLLPFISPQKYNKYLKVAMRRAGITRTVFVLNTASGINEPKRLCDIASSHMARRTFMANMFKLTRSERITSSFTGHAENSKAFSRYVNVDDEMKKDIIGKL